MGDLITPSDEVLECACGTGLLTGVIVKKCKSLVATDFSANMLKKQKRNMVATAMWNLKKETYCKLNILTKALML